MTTMSSDRRRVLVVSGRCVAVRILVQVGEHMTYEQLYNKYTCAQPRYHIIFIWLIHRWTMAVQVQWN